MSVHREGAHREGAWSQSREAPTPPQDGRRLALELGALGLVGGVALGAGATCGLGLPLAGLAVGFGALGLHGRRRDDRERDRAARVLALRAEFGVGPAWPVDLVVQQGEAPTGRDQGLLWVEGGRIVFSGFRTSFALAPDQIASPVRQDAAVSGLRLRLGLALCRETPVGPLALSFWPVADGWKRAEDDAATLRYALNTIIEDGRRRPDPEVVGQWPPTAVGPGAHSPRVLRQAALGRMAAWTGVAAVVAAFFVPYRLDWGLGAFVLLALGLNLMTAAENRPRWRAYRDAQRLWRET